MPQCAIPSVVLRISGAAGGPEALAARLRAGAPAVLGHVAEDAFVLDLRTVLPGQDETLARAVKAVFAGS